MYKVVYTIQSLNQLNIILQKQSSLIFKDSGRVSRLSRKTKVVSIEIMGWRILVVRLGMDFLKNALVRIEIRLC